MIIKVMPDTSHGFSLSHYSPIYLREREKERETQTDRERVREREGEVREAGRKMHYNIHSLLFIFLFLPFLISRLLTGLDIG